MYTGVVTDAELLASYADLTARPDYDAGADDLVDLRQVDRLEISAEAMRHLIDLFQPVDALGNPTRLAIVAASDFTYGMSRMYGMLRGHNVPEEVQVFRDADEAYAWLERSRGSRDATV